MTSGPTSATISTCSVLELIARPRTAGRTVLVTRRWPRKLPRERVDRWMPRLAPGWFLDRALSRGRVSEEEGAQRYRGELEKRGVGGDYGELLQVLSGGEGVLLVGGPADASLCHREVLADILRHEYALLEAESGQTGHEVLDGELDLHNYRPRDLGTLVPEFIAASQAEGVLELRIVHGKGKGVLRRSVHALLERDPRVARYALAGPEAGGWGATLVTLLPAVEADPASGPSSE